MDQVHTWMADERLPAFLLINPVLAPLHRISFALLLPSLYLQGSPMLRSQRQVKISKEMVKKLVTNWRLAT